MVTKLFFICDWILELTHVIKWHRLKHTHTHTQGYIHIGGLFQCQYPGYIVLQFCKMLPLRVTGPRVHGIFLFYSLQVHVNLQ